MTSDQFSAGETRPAEWLHERTRTDVPEEADAAMRRLYEDGSLRRRSPVVSFRHDLDGRPTSHISRFAFGGAFESSGMLHGAICVIETVKGRYDWEAGDERGTGATIELCQPGAVLTGRTEDAETRVLTITLDELDRYATQVYGHGSTLLFAGATAVSPRLQRAWSFAVDLAEDALRDPGLDAFPLVRAAVERQLVVTTLEAFRSRVEPLARRVDAGAVRRAQTYIDDHASDAVTVDDIAEHLGVPTRALDVAFRTRTGRSLAEALRQARLSGALDELAHALEPVVPEDVVRRWGFRDVTEFTNALRAERF